MSRYITSYPQMTFGRHPAYWLRGTFEVWAPRLALTPENLMWRGSYNLELDEVQIGNHSSYGLEVHSVRMDLRPLPTLAAAKACCYSTDPGPSRPLSLAGTPPSHFATIWNFSSVLIGRRTSKRPHHKNKPVTWKYSIPRISDATNWKGHLRPDSEDKCCYL